MQDSGGLATVVRLHGLVLAGGKSSRMGQDKSRMAWHGKEQMYYMADLLAKAGLPAYISCRGVQMMDIDPAYALLPDTVPGAGPLVGLLSAYAARPGAAWLVVACDMPLMDMPTMQQLIEARDPAALATTYTSPTDGLPEPLITIWEPAAYPLLRAWQQEGYNCPRKWLLRHAAAVKSLVPDSPHALLNTNTPDDAARAWELLHSNPR